MQWTKTSPKPQLLQNVNTPSLQGVRTYSWLGKGEKNPTKTTTKTNQKTTANHKLMHHFPLNFQKGPKEITTSYCVFLK